MTKVIYNPKFPAFDRDEFLTPFDRMFDHIVSSQFPEIEKQIGVKPFKQLQSKRHVLAKDLKELKAKYKDVFKSEEILYGHFFSSLDKLNAAVDMMIDQDRKLRGPGGLVWLWQVLEGENKGHIGFCYLTREPNWEVDFLNKSTEFILET